jgi:hypothetical protein
MSIEISHETEARLTDEPKGKAFPWMHCWTVS